MPSCWYDAQGRIEYLFEVRLRADGFVVSATDLPHRIEARAALPVGALPQGSVVGPDAFTRATRPIYDWSVRHLCRFFVLVRDETPATEKALFKQRLRTVEQHFYKRLT